MQYVSNKSRQQITVANFLQDNHYLSQTSYSDYSTGILQKKLAKSLGSGLQSDNVVDWEVNGVRTAPIDQTSDSLDLQSIADGTEQQSRLDQNVEVVDE